MQGGKDLLALMEVTAESASGISNSGQVDLELLGNDLYSIREILPKREGPFVPRFVGGLRTCGMTLSGPYLFDFIDRARETFIGGEFTDVPVCTLIMQGRGLLGCRLLGTVFDISNPLGYTFCQRHLMTD
jgi:hypothetical protein